MSGRHTVHRYEVPVGGDRRFIMKPGHITRVEAASPDIVEFWMIQMLDADDIEGFFTVVGTGHPVPSGLVVYGSTQRIDGLVWHLAGRFAPSMHRDRSAGDD